MRTTPAAPAAGALTVADRAERGRAARRAVPRSSHAEWERPAEARDPLEILREEEADRVPELVPLRNGRMLSSPFAFLRGSAAVMAQDLAGRPASGIQVQACGDAHVANFGGFAAPDRRIVFDINDFDETLRAPWEWDVKRLAASLAVAGRHRGVDAAGRRRIVEGATAAYRLTIRRLSGMRDIDVWYARTEADALLDRLGERLPADVLDRARRRLTRARRKDSMRALRRLTVDSDAPGPPQIVSDPPLIVPIRDLVDASEAESVMRVMERLLAQYRASLRPDLRHLMRGYRFADLARKVVGVGSVGTRAWILLLTGRDAGDPLFLQVKEAGPSVLEPYAGRSPYRHGGRRVVEGQRLMQATGDLLLGWVRNEEAEGGPRDFYVRQLWDAKASVDLEAIEPEALGVYGELCGETLARAHARSGDRIAIAAYLGGGPRFDEALADFAELYADQTERDHAALAAAVDSGEMAATTGV